jgi:molecular chaperone DnaK
MNMEAEANAEANKIEKENIEKINSADSMIFQTEKQLKEYGDKLSENNKQAIEEALQKLKDAHKSQDLAAIDAALEVMNKAWEGVSQNVCCFRGSAASSRRRSPAGRSNSGSRSRL